MLHVLFKNMWWWKMNCAVCKKEESDSLKLNKMTMQDGEFEILLCNECSIDFLKEVGKL